MAVDLELTGGVPARMKCSMSPDAVRGSMFMAKAIAWSRFGIARIDLPQPLARSEAVWHKTGPVFSRLSCVSQPTTEVG